MYHLGDFPKPFFFSVFLPSFVSSLFPTNIYMHEPGVLLNLVCWIQCGHNVIEADEVPALGAGLAVYWGTKLSNYIKGGKCHEEGRQARTKALGRDTSTS